MSGLNIYTLPACCSACSIHLFWLGHFVCPLLFSSPSPFCVLFFDLILFVSFFFYFFFLQCNSNCRHQLNPRCTYCIEINFPPAKARSLSHSSARCKHKRNGRNKQKGFLSPWKTMFENKLKCCAEIFKWVCAAAPVRMA